VELRIAAARVPVVESTGNQTTGVDLRNGLNADSGECRMPLDQVEDNVDGLVMGGDDLFLYADIGGRPER
jgi:hypothetical protein